MVDPQNKNENIEMWKNKKLIKLLEAARGNGTSMISIIIPPFDKISWFKKKLGDEFRTASNIDAITSALQRLNLYNEVPPNGLMLYTGTIVTEEGNEKTVTIDFEPFRRTNASLYLLDNKFDTDVLRKLLESVDKFGFIIIDGSGTLFGMLSGNSREVLHKFNVCLPKEHGRGGQSALSFGHLRMEKKDDYLRKAAELAKQLYINPVTNRLNISALIIAGWPDFNRSLALRFQFVDKRLSYKIKKVVNVYYGGENGFNEAINLSAEILGKNKFIQEKRLIGNYFKEISQETGKYVYGVDDTFKALKMGALDTLIVWENLDITRYTLTNIATGDVVIKHLNKEQEGDQNNFRDSTTNAVLEVQEKTSLLEWFADEYRNFGCTLEFVTNKSTEGSQFCRGFGGIGGILRFRYKLHIRLFDEVSDDEMADNELVDDKLDIRLFDEVLDVEMSDDELVDDEMFEDSA